MHVFLVGFMGSGKTSIGKPLAKQMGIQFVDMDTSLEQQETKTISEIFKDSGEDYFREIEAKWLGKFESAPAVVSVGGGTPCFHDNLSTMKKKGIVVYLTIPVEMMAQRVLAAKTIRPIIEPYRNDKNKLLRFMSELLAKREPFYKQADIIFEATNMSANKKLLLANMITKCMMKKNLL